jgi:hypothetical protein
MTQAVKQLSVQGPEFKPQYCQEKNVCIYVCMYLYMRYVYMYICITLLRKLGLRIIQDD